MSNWPSPSLPSSPSLVLTRHLDGLKLKTDKGEVTLKFKYKTQAWKHKENEYGASPPQAKSKNYIEPEYETKCRGKKNYKQTN